MATPMLALRTRVPARAFATTKRVWQDIQPADKKLLPEASRAAAAKLSLESLKDVSLLFSSGADDATQPIDTAPIFENPRLFADLTLLHQGQVLKELQDKYDKKWTKLTDQDKKLGYFIAYGDWGVREKFHNWNTHEPPLDLPFRGPWELQSGHPKPTDKIHKLEPVYLAETEVRKEQFDTSKMDPVTKTFIYLTVFVALLALARDKKVGEAGQPVEVVVEDQYLKQREEAQRAEEARQEAELKSKTGRKWYYLWMR